MASNDGIMSEFKYTGTAKIINLSIEIGKKLGIIDATYLRKPKTKLRKSNRIKSIQSSLWIEGNTLSIEQVTEIFKNKRVIFLNLNMLTYLNYLQATLMNKKNQLTLL